MKSVMTYKIKHLYSEKYKWMHHYLFTYHYCIIIDIRDELRCKVSCHVTVNHCYVKQEVKSVSKPPALILLEEPPYLGVRKSVPGLEKMERIVIPHFQKPAQPLLHEGMFLYRFLGGWNQSLNLPTGPAAQTGLRSWFPSEEMIIPDAQSEMLE